MITSFQLQANKYAHSFCAELENWVKTTLFSNFTLTVSLDWNPSRRSSRGGMYKSGPGINMAMYWAISDSGGYIYKFNEYPSFDADKHIGGFYATDPYLKLRAILAHEVAHAVQFHSYKVMSSRCKPHGPVFKSYYTMLRDRFVNDLIPEQAPLEKSYKDYVNSINKRLGR